MNSSAAAIQDSPGGGIDGRLAGIEQTFQDLHQSVIDRERESSTGLGHNLAVPHARIPAAESPMGVVGILRTPIDSEAPDGEKVDIICLVATPEGKADDIAWGGKCAVAGHIQ